jgi:TPR repeat protein
VEANLNAMGIIFAPMFAIVISLIWGTRYDEKRFLKAVLIPLSIIIVLTIITAFLPFELHLSGAFQLFVPIVCLFPILWFVEKKIVRYSASLALLALAIGLTIQYEYLARSGDYSFDEPAKIVALNNFQRVAINMMLYAAVDRDSNSYPEGWLSDSPFVATLSENHRQSLKEHCKFDRPQTYRLWHSPFTHIYGARKQHLELWYPGGKLSGTTIGKISMRKRSDFVAEPAQNSPQKTSPAETRPKEEQKVQSSQKEEQIDAFAECDLGWRYFYGWGVQQDYTKAAKCFRRAIDSVANRPEQNKLGWCYYRGRGIEPNYANPVTWFRKEAEKGNADAQYFMGWLSLYGSGKLKPDRAKAVMWWKKSAQQGFAEAQYELAVEYFYLQRNHTEGIKWQYKAARQGFDMSQSDIEMYLNSSDPNYPEAVKWLIEAAQQGNSRAQARLVGLAERGWISMVEGYKWALIAIANGCEDHWTQTLKQGSRLMGRKPMASLQIAQAEELARDFKEVKSEVSARAITTMYQAMTMRQENDTAPEFFFPSFW